MKVLQRRHFGRLFEVLHEDGYEVIGPTLRDGAIVYDSVEAPSELPAGWTEEQAPGYYRIRRRDDAAFFGHRVGPHSWKQQLFPSREKLYRARRREDGRVGFEPFVPEPRPRAFLGVRACDLAAIRTHDRILLHSDRREPRYESRRSRLLLVAVHCTEAGDLCFCESMGTGPRVGPGADLVLGELGDRFTVQAHTDLGQAVLDRLPTDAAEASDEQELDDGIEHARRTMGRTLNTSGLADKLFANLDHPRWAEVAERCLSCGNCTNVCPTCFCTTCEEHSDLQGSQAERVRLWDSCFTEGHGEIHGTNVRPTIEARYRQWLTHKLGSWVSQFGSSGCVGCGRCIAWCPVGIDLTEEATAVAESPVRPSSGANRGPTLPAAPAPQATPPHEDQVPRSAEVLAVQQETHDVHTLHLRTEGSEHFKPGQFHMLSLAGLGEAAISISGAEGPSYEHTIRAVGPLTEALTSLEPGQQLGLRGPYGTAWPLEQARGRPVVLVSGGIGLAPLRGAIRQMLAEPHAYPDVRLLYGARNPRDVLYATEMLGWAEGSQLALHVTVDHAAPSWRGHVGVVTRMLRRGSLPDGALYLICGPEVMMRFTVQKLLSSGVSERDLYVSMERHMKCAVGFCGRCQLGPWFVCKDGPVFRYDQVRGLAL